MPLENGRFTAGRGSHGPPQRHPLLTMGSTESAAEVSGALNVAVLVDGNKVQQFALDALDAADGFADVTVFSCTNTSVPRRILRHGAYYALNVFAIRNRLARKVPIDSGRKRISRIISFESGRAGAWQTLPPHIVQSLCAAEFDIILKFGMSLLQVPPHDYLPIPILSYHHGDPRKYRGRPAGFWEMMNDEPVIGQIVQVIGNRLDAGEVVAFGETKVLRWSYGSTLLAAYRHSPLLINRAIRNAIAGTPLNLSKEGKNYRLPSNLSVLRFVAKTAKRYLRRLVYGLFYEKKWNVSTAAMEGAGVADLAGGHAFPPVEAWETVKRSSDYTFYADPFFSSEPPGLLVEALNRRTALGEILLLADGGEVRVSGPWGHCSYPSTFTLDGRQFVLPETASWSPPTLYRLIGDRLAEPRPLKMETSGGVIDATLFEHSGRFYLFGSEREIGGGALFLWSSDRIDGQFRRHPKSPVRVSPLGSRMGGNLVRYGARLFRFGQDGSGDYGDGLIVFEVEELSETGFRERRCGHIRFSDRQGPHTLNASGGRIVFDWYRTKFDALAAVRRLRSRAAAA